MGTRSLTHVKNETGKTLVTIYRQFDGYPTGMGADIKRTFKGKTLVNGYTNPETQVNGMGCAAAMLIAELKDGCGNVYIDLPNAKDGWEEYIYTLSASKDMVLQLEVKTAGWRGSPSPILYKGPLVDFDPKAVEAKMDEDA